MRNADFAVLERMSGIHFPDVLDFIQSRDIGADFNLAMDAQPGLITTPNNGIPAYLANYLDPKVIEVLVTPNKAAEIAGEEKKGDWVTLTAQFMMHESTGEVSSYGDWSNNGSTGANYQFPTYQSYHYQTITQWGDRQLAMAGLARINFASDLNVASALVLNKFQNKSYFFGIAGLQNYGLLNEPRLSSPITPTAAWSLALTDANGVYEDIRRIFVRLQTQCQGLIDKDAPMTLAMSPTAEVATLKTNSFGISVSDLLKKNFPNMKIKTAVEYSTASGELVQLYVDSIEGQKTVTTAFTEKMRAHNIVRGLSAYKQKKSQGTWGAILFRPFGVAQMLGV